MPFEGIANRLGRFLEYADLTGFGPTNCAWPVLVAECRSAGAHFAWTSRAVIDVLQIYHQREWRDPQAALAFYYQPIPEQANDANCGVCSKAFVLDVQLRHYCDLPHSMHKLQALLASRLGCDHGQPIFVFGTHAGRCPQDVAREDPGYVEWLLPCQFLDDAKDMVRMF